MLCGESFLSCSALGKKNCFPRMNCPEKLPAALSPEEVAQFFPACAQFEIPGGLDDLLWRRGAHFRGGGPAGERYRLQAHADSRSRRQRWQGPVGHHGRAPAQNPAHVLAQQNKLRFSGERSALSNPTRFADYLKPTRKAEWVVYAKPLFGGPAHVLEYLGRYTHRVALSNDRILDIGDDAVTFQWKDYRNGEGRTKSRRMRLDAAEFIRRFVLHVLPDQFQRNRPCGFLANRRRKEKLARRRRLYKSGRRGTLTQPRAMRRRLGDYCPSPTSPLSSVRHKRDGSSRDFCRATDGRWSRPTHHDGHAHSWTRRCTPRTAPGACGSILRTPLMNPNGLLASHLRPRTSAATREAHPAGGLPRRCAPTLARWPNHSIPIGALHVAV